MVVSTLINIFLKSPVLVLVLVGTIALWGWRSFSENPKDAIPDIAENQTIVFTEWMGRSPKDVDEQVTYPLAAALQGIPKVKEIRATSGFGWSIVYVVFQDGVDFYWARSRVLERLNVAQRQLPEGVTPTLGPDATALGQVFWYTIDNGWYSPSWPGLRFNEDGTLTASSRLTLLENDPTLREQLDGPEPYTCPLSGGPLVFSQLSLDERRSIQDFDLKLALESVAGVSEAASVGGYVRQYQIDVSPEALRAFDVSLDELVAAVKSSNVDVGAKVIEESGMEILVRGVGFLGGGDRSTGTRAQRERAAIRDIENIVIKAVGGTPIYIRQLAQVASGPDFRRGALDKMGAETVGGCVIMRYGENPLEVIDRVKSRMALLEGGLPAGVRVNAFYDRTQLINETMGTLRSALSQELMVTIIAVLIFLLHVRSSLVVAVMLPLAVLFAFICMQALKLPSNIMSLAGIAIAIGTMVDMGIVMTENIYQHLTDGRDQFTTTVTDDRGRPKTVIDRARRAGCVRNAALEVGPAIATAVSTTVVSFLPVFFLEGQAAKLFTPLAWTKTFCMVGAAMLALTLVPTLAGLLLSGRRMPVRRAALIGVVVGAGAGLLWFFGRLGSTGYFSIRSFTTAIEDYLGLSHVAASILLAVLVALLAVMVLRERIKPIHDNAVSRLIRSVYEPTLRWILRHPLLFLSLPALIVVWGLSIWLGWVRVLGVLVAPLSWVGLAPRSWSLAWWVHLGLGCVIGLVFLPLVMDTVRVWRARMEVRNVTAAYTWSKRLLAVVVTVLVVALLQSINLADRQAPATSAIFGAALKKPSAYAPLSVAAGQQGGIGQEFMPPLDEGDFLYMPSVLPAGSINTVREVMQKQDALFAQIPEVELVVGKLGRIESALDPAPVGMIETVINLKPREQWPTIDDPQHPGHLRQRTMNEIWDEIQQVGRFPGVLPSVQLQPIRTRVEMLSTGLNAKIGIKIYGDNIRRCEELAVAIEQLLRQELQGAEAVNAIRTSGKPYLEFRIDREAIARYGVNMRDVQDVIEVAVGGMNLTTTYEGLDRYPVRVRYPRQLRDDVDDLQRILVPTPAGAQIPITQVADIERVVGPMSVRREGANYVSYVTMTNVGVDETTLVTRGQAIIEQAVIAGTLEIPQGYYTKWTGSYERDLRAKKRLAMLIPLVLIINFVLIYLQFKRLSLVVVVFLAIPVAFAGGFILLHFWPAIQNTLFLIGVMDRPFQEQAMYLTVAVWVGFIALFGIAVDDGIVMGTYLDQNFGRSRITRYEEIAERVVQAGLRRIRPCLMTTFTTLVALVPVLLSTGRGSDVMVPMALPVFGGMLVALVTLFVVPAGYCGLKQLKWRLRLPDPDFAPDAA